MRAATRRRMGLAGLAVLALTTGLVFGSQQPGAAREARGEGEARLPTLDDPELTMAATETQTMPGRDQVEPGKAPPPITFDGPLSLCVVIRL